MQQNICGANSVKYTIGKGQTLYAIAQQYNTTVQAILDANPGLDVQLYYAGDVICIPQGSGPSQETGCVGGTPYTIRRGDSFYLIAQRFDIPLADLLAANPGVDPARLLVGQVICVPVRAEEACPSGYSVHTVMRGQTFVDLQVLYNISFAALEQANPNVDIRNLQEGQQLCIAPVGTRGNCESGNAPYTMRQGDTLSGLAQRYNTSVGDILIANPLLTPTDFVQGRIICLPAASGGAQGGGNTNTHPWYGGQCFGGKCGAGVPTAGEANEKA
ncbi:MAG TPA: LysM peptidoglycan-binding domain-containing protein [Candidatus Aphodomonas merdavium]|nr:LysM peptidoglycan-binding domain-containing protein [Candidatus Aphodomonas merdavium]